MKEPMSKLMGIGDRTLKSLRMVEEHIPTPPVFRSKLRGIKPKGLRPNKTSYSCVSAIRELNHG
jgi:hypothetical protein